MKKFLSISVAGAAAGLGDAAAVVVAGEIAVAGVMPGTVAVAIGFAGAMVAPGTAGAAGVVSGAVVVVVGAVAGLNAAAGLVAVVGGAPGALVAGDVEVAGGDVWPNVVSARVTELRLAISSVFIGLIAKFCRARIAMSRVSSSTA
jgi:hypothetical protein